MPMPLRARSARGGVSGSRHRIATPSRGDVAGLSPPAVESIAPRDAPLQAGARAARLHAVRWFAAGFARAVPRASWRARPLHRRRVCTVTALTSSPDAANTPVAGRKASLRTAT
jgi:hypothetical protein